MHCGVAGGHRLLRPAWWSLTDVPSICLLEDLLCHEYYYNTSSNLMTESNCKVEAVQDELNIVAMGTLIIPYLPGEFCLSTLSSFRVRRY